MESTIELCVASTPEIEPDRVQHGVDSEAKRGVMKAIRQVLKGLA